MRILFCILVLCGNLKAQDYFFKVNKNFNYNVTNTQLIKVVNKIFLVSSGLCNNVSCETLTEINAKGDYLWGYTFDNISLTAQTCFYRQDTIYLTGNGSPINDRTVIFKYSIKDNRISRHEIMGNNQLYDRFNILTSIPFKDKIILTGQSKKNERSQGIIMVLNKSMTVDTILIDNGIIYQSDIWQSTTGPDSLLTCIYRVVNNFWPNEVRRIIKFDDHFNQVWSYTSDTLGINRTYPRGTVLRDGRLAFVDFKPEQNSGLNSLRCLDTITKRNSWMFSYQNVPSWGRKLYSVKQLRNGDIICTGEYTTKTSAPRIEGSPYMMRVDSTGKLLWERAYVEIAPDGEDKGGSLWDVIELDNGDLMAVGFVTNDRKWDPLIIRTDHRGCMDGGNTTCPTVRIIDLTSGTEDEIKSSKSLPIYPNPGDDHLRIDVADDMLFPLRYELSGLSGQRVTIGYHNSGDNFMLDTSHLPTGMYFIRLVDNSGKVWQSKWVKM